jgi:hypothetical protein
MGGQGIVGVHRIRLRDHESVPPKTRMQFDHLRRAMGLF